MKYKATRNNDVLAVGDNLEQVIEVLVKSHKKGRGDIVVWLNNKVNAFLKESEDNRMTVTIYPLVEDEAWTIQYFDIT